MRKFANIFLIIFLLLGFRNIYSQTTRFDSLVLAGIDQIYSIQFEEAQKTFQLVKKEYPLHPSGKFFEAMIIWWQILLDLTSEELDDQFYDRLEEVIDMCDDILDEDEENVDAYFFKGGALGFRARLLAIRRDWINAAMDGKEALPLVFDAHALDSTNVDVQLGFGIYHYYAEVIPEHYPFVKPVMIFFPEGDKENGLKQLELAASQGKFSQVEALYFLMTSYYRYESDYSKAHEYVDILRERYPTNPVFHRYKGRIFVRQGNYNDASIIFDDILAKCDSGKFGYTQFVKREASYYIATNQYYLGNIDSAYKFYSMCETISKTIDIEQESGFLINSAYYLAQIYEKKNMIEKAKQKYEEILEYRDFSGSEEKAAKALARLEKANPAE